MRWPLWPTLFVAAAVATMIGLGIWQLGRAEEKEALKARFAENSRLPEMALPPTAAVDESLLYRRARAFCLEPTSWRLVGGRSASGRPGTRYLAECRTGAEGPGFVADMGVSPDPQARPGWRGGEVAGVVVAEPRRGSLYQRLTGRVPSLPPRPMIVAAEPAPGLEPTAPPAPAASNNSWFYAFQWFFFALAAAAIYVLALRRRGARVAAGAPEA